MIIFRFYTKIIIGFLMILFLFLDVFNVVGSSDAIAIRVMKNDKHISALKWYRQNIKNQGAPQSLVVDGYEAVRDGRTVYVNAGNVVNGNFFTNIYLISYNQGAEKSTEDIFGQILAHWKFNSNITDLGFCGNSSFACHTDLECNEGEFCTSPKAKLTRDVRRLASIYDINEALEKYKSARGEYPKLSAGSYLPGKTLSIWPSWFDTLGQDLNLNMPIDPINKIIGCDDPYNKITCWDEIQKEFKNDDFVFGNSINKPIGQNFYIFKYQHLESSASSTVCAFMETNYITRNMGNCK